MRGGSQIYVSASIPDRPVAQKIVALLQSEEGYDVHWEETELGALSANAQAAAERARCVLVVWSYTSVSSRWVRQEALEAAARNALVEIEIARVGRPTNGECISFAEWDLSSRAPEWRRLMEKVRAVVGRPQGELPVKEQMSSAAGAAMLATVGAFTMMLGARPPSPDLLALSTTNVDPLGPINWAEGGPAADQLPAAAPLPSLLAERPTPFSAPPLDLQWGEPMKPLQQASIDLIPAIEVGVTTLAYNAEIESGETALTAPSAGAISLQ